VPSYFLDSSALVKRYHRERGTEWVQALVEVRAHPQLYVSQLAEVEVVAALRRVGRSEGYHPSSVDALVNLFLRHLARSDSSSANPTYLLVPLLPSILSLASTLCNRYWDATPNPLRSLDAIQLACAVATAVNIPHEIHFVTADTRLAAIAAFEGLRVINPSYPPPL
jgi:uncharacterized protein